jgi:putative flippase GtrA
MEKFISRSVLLFLVIGLANGMLTLAIISICYFFDSSDEMANFLGILGGMVQSIILNSKYTFQQEEIVLSKSIYFFSILALSYLINFYILYLCLNIMKLPSFLSQLVAIMFYVISSYVLLRKFVFKK